ncbi:hypothetical protein PHYSODRAFT_308353 [Phytophthora sojae]|uniref:Uncharacterized protein n=1 Tax=Phytophthora sojae (strain P6497) TaxID=1094619 RepID=G4YJR5_PHYSP|nr:hypothetical protein PHYSODRAFT_308353 [Phytophthora sojae]EGZ26622.1 hypothetical protein PHYSODRAFT_308353 [Phytophthora sojae]|eukprot:XP_009513897.1 hypothetical protein PHYSODRAFT_308353 [Phytophthora sojae]
MDEHRHYLEEQYNVLRAAEEAVGLQSQRLKSLAEAVQPHLQARWGAFAQGAAPSSTERPPEAAAVTVVAGTNLTVPPIYRGSSKKEKRGFMDSYAIYTRRVKALNQGTHAKFFVMPLSACIEQGTMVRICGFELFKEEKDTLDREVKALCMGIEPQDAESRLSRLMAQPYEIIDQLNMEDVVHTEPKKAIGYFVGALRPQLFKAAEKDQLSRQCHKSTKSDLAAFLKWLRGELQGFMRFEAHISAQTQAKGGTKPTQQQQSNRGFGGTHGATKVNSTDDRHQQGDQQGQAKTDR